MKAAVRISLVFSADNLFESNSALSARQSHFEISSNSFDQPSGHSSDSVLHSLFEENGPSLTIALSKQII